MFLRFLADDGTGLVALGTPLGSRNRGFSLSLFSFLGYGCPKHIMFLYNFYRTLSDFSKCVLLLLAFLMEQFYDFSIVYFS